MLRSNPRLSHLIIVLVSSCDKRELDNLAKQVHADAVVSKRERAHDAPARDRGALDRGPERQGRRGSLRKSVRGAGLSVAGADRRATLRQRARLAGVARCAFRAALIAHDVVSANRASVAPLQPVATHFSQHGPTMTPPGEKRGLSPWGHAWMHVS